MILDKEITINVTNTTKSHFASKGYDVSNEKISVKIEDLPTFSHHKIRVKCDICGKEKELPYMKYQKNTKFNTSYYSCSQKCSVEKLMNTFMKNYGCVSSQHPDVKLKQAETNEKLYGGKSCQCDKKVKQKSYDTMIERYGFKHALQNKVSLDKFMLKLDDTIEKTNKTKVKRGLMVDYQKYSTYQEYRKLVECETRKHKKRLYAEWNGLDYYDNEYIKENFKLEYKDKLYPSIDHKISILYGFNNQIDPYEIGRFDNLCITKRSNNSKKHSKNML